MVNLNNYFCGTKQITLLNTCHCALPKPTISFALCVADNAHPRRPDVIAPSLRYDLHLPLHLTISKPHFVSLLNNETQKCIWMNHLHNPAYASRIPSRFITPDRFLRYVTIVFQQNIVSTITPIPKYRARKYLCLKITYRTQKDWIQIEFLWQHNLVDHSASHRIRDIFTSLPLLVLNSDLAWLIDVFRLNVISWSYSSFQFELLTVWRCTHPTCSRIPVGYGTNLPDVYLK